MPQPDLIQPVEVVIEQFDNDETVFDTNAREPIRGREPVRTVTVSAQVRYRDYDDPAPSIPGTRMETRGKFVVKNLDLENSGIALQIHDRIIQIGEETGLDFYLMRYRPSGHWSDVNGPTLTKWWFASRNPVA